MVVIPEPIKIIIAEELLLMREGLLCVLAKNEAVQVVGDTNNTNELLQLIRQRQPDIVVLDTSLHDMDGVQATRTIRQRFPTVKIITLWRRNDARAILTMKAAGASGFVLKNTGKKDLLEAVVTTQQGGDYFSKAISDSIIDGISRAPFYRKEGEPHLSRREIEVIQLMCQEYSSKEIAALLSINSRSVESYRERIQKKIKAKNMIGIVLFAIRNGLYNIDATYEEG
jgi:DNA-binding NarL/FixJ family response regulator